VVDLAEPPGLEATPATVAARARFGRAWQRRALLALLFLGLVELMLRPTWHSLDRTVPDLGDPVLYIWALSWGGHAIVHQPLHLFDANIYWPHPLTLAYSDSLLVLAAPFNLIRALGGSWALALNVTMVGLLVLTQASTYLLARWFTGRTDAALLASTAFTFSSFLFVHFGHTQLLLTGLFPLCFYLLFRALDERSLRWSAWLGIANVAMLTGALYYAAIYVVCVMIIVGGWVWLHRRDLNRQLARCFLVAGAITLLAVPTLVPYARLGQSRPAGGGLHASDLMTVSPGSFLYPNLDRAASKRGGRTEHTFFPGFSTEVLAIVGLGAAVGSRRRRGGPQPLAAQGRYQYLWLLLAAAGVSLVIALGPEVHGVTMPFQVLHSHVPGFKNIRAVARLVMPAMLTCALLASIGFSHLTRRFKSRTAALTALAVGAFMLLEFAAPVHRAVLPTDNATLAVYRALATEPRGAVAELPMAGEVSPPREWAFVEAPRMVYGSIDWHDRVNGYSGSAPADYIANLRALDTFPSSRALQTARKLRLRYLVLHTGDYGGFPQYTPAHAQAIVRALPSGMTAQRFGDSWLIDLAPTAHSPAAGTSR
jgi:hypothetical protein